MTVQSNHAITLFLVGFLIGSAKWRIITLPIRNKRGIDGLGPNKLANQVFL